MTSKVLRVGLLGLGTVGCGLLQMIFSDGPLSQKIIVNGVHARSKNRERPVDISALKWYDNALDLAKAEDIDVFIELMGGKDGLALEAVETALKNKKHVVTANKAMLAAHGLSLAKLAKENGVDIRYEAAVAGGIPIVKALREGLAGNKIKSISGVMNGTSNFILTTMEKTGRSFADVLAEAQALGYAEADPTLDINGGDAAHKLTLLSALAFTGIPDFDSIELDGIETIEPVDLETAKFLGYAVKLIANASVNGDEIRQSVRPSLVKHSSPIAGVDGATNAVMIEADPVGTLTFIGAGAGAGPTASAVSSDLVDLYYGDSRPLFSGPYLEGRTFKTAEAHSLNAKFYVRFNVKDKPGVIAKISDTLARHQVSIESFLQKPPVSKDNVVIVLTTQECNESVLIDAITELSGFEEFSANPLIMPLMN